MFICCLKHASERDCNKDVRYGENSYEHTVRFSDFNIFDGYSFCHILTYKLFKFALLYVSRVYKVFILIQPRTYCTFFYSLSMAYGIRNKMKETKELLGTSHMLCIFNVQ